MKKECRKNIFCVNPRAIIGICVLGLIALFFTSCASLELQSSWKNSDISIDGKSDDWVGHLMYVDNQNISIGVMNDTNYLYACVVAEDQILISKIMRQGMTLWFNPEGGKNKFFGIKYPKGREDMPQEDRENMRPGTKADPQNRRRELLAISNEVEILQERKVPIQRTTDNLKGIEVFLNRSTGLIVYEIKVPLQTDTEHPFAINAQEGTEIGIGIEVPKMTLTMNRPAGGMGGGGMGGRGGGMGGRGGGMGGGGMGGRSGGMTGQRTNMQKSIKIWAVVGLATAK